MALQDFNLRLVRSICIECKRSKWVNIFGSLIEWLCKLIRKTSEDQPSWILVRRRDKGRCTILNKNNTIDWNWIGFT